MTVSNSLAVLLSQQPYNYHISFCGDLDVVGMRKPQSYLRAVLFNASQMEMAVHAPVAPGEHEVRQ